jgi:hypothetical protein
MLEQQPEVLTYEDAEVAETYVQSLFTDEETYAELLNGISNKARQLVQSYSESEDATLFRDSVLDDDEQHMFIYNRLQSAISREFRFVTVRELYEAVDASDSYGTQAEINPTSISNILADPHIGIFTLQQLLTPPHLTERININTNQPEYVGVGLRHRIVTLTLLAHVSGIDVYADEWLDQNIQCLVSSSIDAEGVEDTELSGALVLADNASRKAFQGEKASFKLNSLGVAYDEPSLVNAAFSGRIAASEAFGTILTLYTDDLNRKSTTLLSVGKAFYNRAKKYIQSKVEFVEATHWITDNFNLLEAKFIAENDSANIARQASKFSTFVFESWKIANRVQEPLKATNKKKKAKGKTPFFKRSVN